MYENHVAIMSPNDENNSEQKVIKSEQIHAV